MTIVLAWHLGDSAILATDTGRTHYTKDASGAPLVNDDVEKVFRIPLGMVAMTGLDLVTDPLLACLAAATREELSDLPAKLREIHESVKAAIAPDEPWLEDADKPNGSESPKPTRGRRNMTCKSFNIN